MNIILNVKSNYQLLSSLIKIEDLIDYALNNNIKCIGVTDSNMFSFMEFYSMCKSNNIKPVLGIDININNSNFILYAKNYRGYVNLCKIVSAKNLSELSIELIKNYKDDLICVLYNDSKDYYEVMLNIFNDVYIAYENDKELNDALMICKNILYMNEVLCFDKKDYEYLKYLYMIRDAKTVNDEINYEIINKNLNLNINERDAKTNEEFIKKIDLEIPKFEFDLPKYTENSNEYLEILCKKGLTKRLNNEVDEKYLTRLNYEIKTIEDMGFTDYFLIVYDIVLYAKKNKIYVGPGRGSAVGSLVSYSLGIIDIDPLKYNLLFERFLNKERISMPDIDIDISDTGREKLINYIKEKYGVDKVANIITFSTLLPKQVLRDVGRVLDISTKKMDSLLSLLKDKDTLVDLKNNYKYKDLIKFNKEYIKLLEISTALEGLKKHASIHAAGVVVSSESLDNKVPLYKSGDNIIVGYDKKHIEELGILKIDLLSIRNLSIIDEVLNEIKNVNNIDINLNNINLDDKLTIDLFKKGNTIGIFQYESTGMRNLIKKMNVNSFNDLVVAVAMFRPGPMNMIPSYLKRREGKEKITYPVKELEGILKETLGIMVYQEQLLQILNIMGGYTYSEADLVRSAIKSKNESILQNERKRFKEKSLQLGYNEKDIDNVYDMILRFASYGFNKSHSVAYALVGYQMAYLKANHPDIFMINLLNKEIGREFKTKEYIDEAKILGLLFNGVDINDSKDYYYEYKSKIILPLKIVKNVGDVAIKKILDERKSGNFASFIDFVVRCYSSSVNKKVIESLILVGAFDSFGINKKTLIDNLDIFINYALLCNEIGNDYVIPPEINEISEYDNLYLLEKESELLGFYFSNHPVTRYKRENGISTKIIEKYYDKNINIILLIESIKEIKTKNNEKMAFLKLSDEYGNIDAVIFPSYYKDIYNDLKRMVVVNTYCKVEKRLNNYQLVINKIEFLK